jgi:hypothetical protein
MVQCGVLFWLNSCERYMNAEHCLFVLGEWFFAFLKGMGVSFEEAYFQRDEAWPHTANAVLCVRSERVHNSVQHNQFHVCSVSDWSKPAYSPDLTQCDFFLFLSPEMKYKVPIYLWLIENIHCCIAIAECGEINTVQVTCPKGNL